MTIESLQQRLNAIEAQSTLQRTYTENSNQITPTTEDSDGDSYISTLGDSSAILPSETYGNIMEQIKAAKQENGENPSAPTEEDFSNVLSQLSASSNDANSVGSKEDVATEASTSGTSGSSGSGESSESESVREYVVGSDGSIYLKITTTDSEGNETVTMTKISDKPKQGSMTPPPMTGEEESSEQQV